MTTQYEDDFDLEQEENEQPQQQQQEPQWRKNLERKAKEADAAKAEAQAAKRELALLKAGIDLESPTGKLFAKAYDGEASVDAIKSAATEYGLIGQESAPAAPTQSAPSVSSDELAAHQRIAQASAGANSGGQYDPRDAVNSAESVEEVLAILQKEGVVIDDTRPGGFFKI
jgi:hypothetical protein